jgi:hypothetical protein
MKGRSIRVLVAGICFEILEILPVHERVQKKYQISVKTRPKWNPA